MASTTSSYLFGGSNPWIPTDWTSSDDRVRGGASHSYLTITSSSNDQTTARFHGTLDIKTLGGAGFASQRTTTTTKEWDLSPFSGLEVHIPRGDDKRYTLNLKDEILPSRPDGRERSSLSWEVDFTVPKGGGVLRFPWKEFRPTYRGREVEGVEPLDLARVRRVGIMVRSFFGDQEGEFEMVIESIRGYCGREEMRYKDDVSSSTTCVDDEEEFNEKWNQGEMRRQDAQWMASQRPWDRLKAMFCCGI
ncbi:CIA30 family protein [Aspergillus homomorphus CBS 101889]|uniref:CIA30-domain-containing protein n=1 Tax=Aspergillus homomorphus (strain CBS 101889) TaxID=1450537 RepID=A0A395HTD6_ASPHC|nr:CIA30-domain-containing protein [Aspergillus homomorphus CBS 101889]RAL11222.1 CIA30-domain-containing protein [Aspergillus homomorphus CBS 101889]